MLATLLLSHQQKSFFRNARWRRNIFSRILLGVLILYLLFIAIVFAINIESLLKEIGSNPFDTFNSIIIYYFSVDFLLRCFLQPLPSLQIVPYLRFKIRRSTIINHLLYQSLWNVFNLIPVFVIIPFAIKIILPYYGVAYMMFYFVSFFLIVLLNNYMATLINYLSRVNIGFLTIPVLMAASLWCLLKMGVPMLKLSISLGRSMAQGDWRFFVMLLVGLAGTYALVFKTLSTKFYIDQIETKSFTHSSKKYAWLDMLSKYGEIGTYFTLELKLLIRNKRPRQALIMLPVFVIYMTLMNIQNNNTHKLLTMLMMSCIIAMGAAIYGQFIFSWESSYFDGLMARKNNLANYVKTKYYLMIAMVLAIFIPMAIALVIAGKTDMVLLLSILLFTLGVLCFIILISGTLIDGRIDLSQNQFFNYQGIKGNQFILSFIIMLLPIGIYMLFNYFIGDIAGKLAIAIPGLIFIVLHDWWIKNIIVPRFMARKYRHIEGHRKLSA